MSELALCIVDDEPRIEDAARVFFQRYSEVGQIPSRLGASVPLTQCPMVISRSGTVHIGGSLSMSNSKLFCRLSCVANIPTVLERKRESGGAKQ